MRGVGANSSISVCQGITQALENAVDLVRHGSHLQVTRFRVATPISTRGSLPVETWMVRSQWASRQPGLWSVTTASPLCHGVFEGFSRILLASGSLAEAAEQRMRLGVFVLAADLPETDRLWATIDAWWEAIEVLIVTGVTNARTEAANTGIKPIKRTSRGYRNADNYQARILLASAARTAA